VNDHYAIERGRFLMDIFFTVLLSILAVFFCLLIARVVQNHLRDAKLLQLREMVHKERMIALERDIQLPNDESEVLTAMLGGRPESDPPSAEIRAAKERVIRLVALSLGLTAFLGGIGLTFALLVQADLDVAGTWGVGIIPTMIGVGLLIFVRLSKSIPHSGRPKESE
jgi:hypothetical protein